MLPPNAGAGACAGAEFDEPKAGAVAPNAGVVDGVLPNPVPKEPVELPKPEELNAVAGASDGWAPNIDEVELDEVSVF